MLRRGRNTQEKAIGKAEGRQEAHEATGHSGGTPGGVHGCAQGGLEAGPYGLELGLYVHIPFCVSKCDYCDFNSRSAPPWLIDLYIEALCAEMGGWATRLRDGGHHIVTAYIGGGTPTILSRDSLADILERVRSLLPAEGGAEFTVEANPGTVGRPKLRAMNDAGVTRLSLGAQAFQDDLLRSIGRIHNAGDIAEAFQLARDEGFDNINMDIIYGLPGQTMALWQETLDAVINLAPEHVSAYGLMLEEGTRLWERVSAGLAEPCDEDTEVMMYHRAKDMLERAGYEHYELSNFARPGYRCRHNVGCWRMVPYIGLGAGAHSYFGGRRFNNVREITDYIGRVASGATAVEECRELSRAEEMSDFMILGLRMLEGVSDQDFRGRFGTGICDVFGAAVRKCSVIGLAEWDGDTFRLTRRGLMLSNEVMREFIHPSP